MLSGLLTRFTRKKAFSVSDTETKLSRCLNTVDLTFLGVGSTLGVGVYVLAGGVAKDTAGPSVVLSFLIAGIASALSGLCYAEFGARVPKAGSAYVYSYVTVGELPAFVVGWNLVLEYVIGTASVARGYSGYLDSLLNNTLKNTFSAAMPISVNFLADYPDWAAFSITLLLTLVLAVGVQESTRFNNIFTILNLSVVMFVIVAGFAESDVENWNIDVTAAKNISHVGGQNLGSGGFFPFGFSGMLSGAATCFYGFVGFDAVATTGEETRNPQKSIPIAIVVSLMIVCLSYIGISSVLTLMLPYYLQNAQAPLPYAFKMAGLPAAALVVTVGALFGLSTSLLGAMFPLPRVVYAMASDGLLPRFLGQVHSYFHTPLAATVLAGFLSALMSLLFDLAQLVDMMSIGTLMAYTMVSLCVLILRYRCSDSDLGGEYSPLSTRDTYDSEEELFPIRSKSSDPVTRRQYFHQMFNLSRVMTPTPLSARVASHSAIMFAVLSVPFCIMTRMTAWHSRIGLVFMGLKLVMCVVVMARQPSDVSNLSFKVPAVPVLPAVSILINVFLTTKLSWETWIRFSVWMVVGFLIYGLYGWKNSSEEYRMRGDIPPEEKDEAQD